MTRAYRLANLKVKSDLALPALPAWNGSEGTCADIVFRRGPVPAQLEQPDHVEAIFQTRGDSDYLLALAGTGRFRVRDGNEVTVEPEANADPIATGAILCGPVQAVLWHQRGLLPLNASAVAIDGRAVALCGPSASGKSTLAAAMAVRGHEVLADDVCIIDARPGAERLVMPGPARLRLWRDALDHLGLAARTAEPALPNNEAFYLDCGEPSAGALRNFSALVILSRQTGGALALDRLHGAWALDALRRTVHTRRAALALGRAAEIFATVAHLASSGPSIWRLRVPDGHACVDAAAARLPAVLAPGYAEESSGAALHSMNQ